MRVARFYIDAPLAPDTQIRLPSTVAHHATRVLRLREGDPIVLFNGRGGEFNASVVLDGKHVDANVIAFDAVERESALSITLVQSWIASDKLDWLIEKSVELGVHAIVLAPSQRSVVRLADDRRTRRIERLREIIVAACTQCGRNRIPSIEASASFRDALELQGETSLGLLLEPNSGGARIAKAQLIDRCIKVLVGPEGGFDPEELALAKAAGYYPYQLGPRILRTETAGLVALAALQSTAGDLA